MGDENHGKIRSGTVSELSEHGEGIIVEKTRRVQVAGSLPGETAFFELVGRKRGLKIAELEGIVSPSKDRIAPLCPYAGVCGGCKWQHAAYDAQRGFKLAAIRADFAAANIPCPIVEVDAGGSPFYYRNRMDFSFNHHGQLGLRESGRWWRMVDTQTCFLQSETSAAIVNEVRAWAKATGLPFYDRRGHEGFFRALVIREGKRTGERLVMPITASPPRDMQADFEALANLLGDRATSVIWGIRDDWADMTVPERIVPIKGDPWLHEEVGGIRYRIAPHAFFQTNTEGAERLQNAVMEYCGDVKDKTVLDLYCGSGFFTLALAKRGAHAIGVELVAEAIDAAKANADLNSLKAEFFAQTAESFDWKDQAPETVIVDPPRAGLHPETLKAVLENRPKTLIYVSCNYRRFLKDAEALGAAYTLAEARAIDLFPQTPHVEIVVKFERIG